jgi:microcompartment protein CcmL/EutN
MKATASACLICRRKGHLASHHVIPREFGGTHGPQVAICGSCHSGIHAAALDGRLDNLSKWFSTELIPRAKPFVIKILQAEKQWNADPMNWANSFVKITATLDRQTHQLLHRLRNDVAPDLSLDEFVGQIISKQLKSTSTNL